MKPDGGPAFPGAHDFQRSETNKDDWSLRTSQGMTLRDYFAAAAVQGLMSNSDLSDIIVDRKQAADEYPAHAAKAVYMLADAMLAEREKS